jgi:hypothetical protein
MANCTKWRGVIRKRVNTNQYYLHVWGVHGKLGTDVSLTTSNGTNFTLSHTLGGSSGVEPHTKVYFLGSFSSAPTNITVNGEPIRSEPTGDHVACSSASGTVGCDNWKGGVLKRNDPGSNNWHLMAWTFHTSQPTDTNLTASAVPASWKLEHVIPGGAPGATAPAGEIANLGDSATQPTVTITGTTVPRLDASTYDMKTCT